MSNKTFIFREEWLDYMDGLSQGQKDAAIRLIIEYAFSGGIDMDEVEMPVRILLQCVKSSIDRDRSSYESRVANGRRGGRRRIMPSAMQAEDGQVTEDAEMNQKEPKSNSVLSKKPNETEFDFGFSEETEKKPGSFKKTEPNRDLSMHDDTLFRFGNPIPNPIPNPNPKNSFSFLFEKEFGGQNEKQKIIFDFFFKGFAAPQREYERLVAYSNRADSQRKWTDMTPQERVSASVFWNQENGQQPRFTKKFLKFWEKVVKQIAKDAPPGIVEAALSDDFGCAETGGTLTLLCQQCLREYIERHLDTLKPLFRAYFKAQNINRLNYNQTDA